MVRPTYDSNGLGGVDLGAWKKIKPKQLIIPLDVHVIRIATEFGLLNRKYADWQAAVELTSNLRLFNAEDPVRYDYALFGSGEDEKRQESSKRSTP
jgi:uncharacterized protein (TIGR02757 family)